MVFSILWLIPLTLIAKSSKVSGKEKLAWFIAVIFISWFSWLIFILIAPVNKNLKKKVIK
jgi:hypothetical protein